MRAPQGDPDNIGSVDVSSLADRAVELIERLRKRKPRVHCITNAVAQNFTANVLLAAGALPSMTIARNEVAAFAARADALLVNLGTFDAERRAASDLAIVEIKAAGKPFVLDPVLIDRSPPRAAYARGLLSHRPSAVRMNAAEFAALSGDGSPQAFAKEQQTIVAITGGTDLVTDGERTLRIRKWSSADGACHRHGLRRDGIGGGSARARTRSADGCRRRDPDVRDCRRYCRRERERTGHLWCSYPRCAVQSRSRNNPRRVQRFPDECRSSSLCAGRSRPQRRTRTGRALGGAGEGRRDARAIARQDRLDQTDDRGGARDQGCARRQLRAAPDQ